MSPELKTKVALIKEVNQIVTNWEDDIGFNWTNKECAKNIVRVLMNKYDITPKDTHLTN